jgi:hypothetical protein
MLDSSHKTKKLQLLFGVMVRTQFSLLHSLDFLRDTSFLDRLKQDIEELPLGYVHQLEICLRSDSDNLPPWLNERYIAVLRGGVDFLSYNQTISLENAQYMLSVIENRDGSHGWFYELMPESRLIFSTPSLQFTCKIIDMLRVSPHLDEIRYVGHRKALATLSLLPYNDIVGHLEHFGIENDLVQRNTPYRH